MTGPWPSTKALSVYNALKLGGDMSRGAVFAYLREHWDPSLGSSYVDDGVEFLLAKKWIALDGENVRLLTRPKVAVRIKDDADLELRTL